MELRWRMQVCTGWSGVWRMEVCMEDGVECRYGKFAYLSGRIDDKTHRETLQNYHSIL